MAEVIIAGFTVYPETVIPTTFVIGSDAPRRSLNGTGFSKDVGQKTRLLMNWPSLDADEMQVVRCIWQALRQTPTGVVVSCTDPYVSGNFIRKGTDLAFEPLEGDQKLYRGSLTIEER